MSDSDISDIEIQPASWAAFLDAFNRQHRGWLVSVEVSNAAGAQLEVRERPFQGVTIDRGSQRRSAFIDTGDREDGFLSFAVPSATRIVFLRTPSGAHRGLSITSSDGSITTVRFRSPAFPEMLDGVPAA